MERSKQKNALSNPIVHHFYTLHEFSISNCLKEDMPIVFASPHRPPSHNRKSNLREKIYKFNSIQPLYAGEYATAEDEIR